MNYKTLKVRIEDQICFLQIYRPEAKNSTNEEMLREFLQVLEFCEDSVTVIVIEGLPEFFCTGADFSEIHEKIKRQEKIERDPRPLYNLLLKLSTGHYITVSHVKGKANAGGIGLIAASDIVIADNTANFSLSELLFGLFPACVLPFLIRRIGFQKANYLTITTMPVSAQKACEWGLVDVYEENSSSLLRKHLIRLRRLSKKGVSRYKNYMAGLYDLPVKAESAAIKANRMIFSDPQNLDSIFNYMENGRFPWDT